VILEIYFSQLLILLLTLVDPATKKNKIGYLVNNIIKVF